MEREKMIITAKNKKEYSEAIRKYRLQGWFLITYTKRFAELEKAGRIIVVEY